MEGGVTAGGGPEGTHTLVRLPKSVAPNDLAAIDHRWANVSFGVGAGEEGTLIWATDRTEEGRLLCVCMQT